MLASASLWLLALVLGAAALVLLLPLASDVVSLLSLAGRRAEPRPAPAPGATRLLFLVPAHNEEMLIGATIASLSRLDYEPGGVRVAVIADNCTDRTAEIARAAGADVLERHDAERRGKPYAIEWALARLPVAEFDGVVVVDADAKVHPGFARALAAAAPLRGKAVQTYNDVSNRRENALTRMAYVFSAVRSVFMNGLKQRAGLNVPLANGLCLGSDVIARHGWTAFSICEDWELYAILTELGVRVENVPQARVYAQEARSLKQSSSQRQRWAAGKIAVLRAHALPLLRSPFVGARQKLDVIAELTAFGPAVHFGVAAVLALVALAAPVPGSPWLAAALAASLVRPAVYTLLAVRVDPEPWKALLAFTYFPFYTVWRLGVQMLAMGMVGSKPWVRTERHADSGVAP